MVSLSLRLGLPLDSIYTMPLEHFYLYHAYQLETGDIDTVREDVRHALRCQLASAVWGNKSKLEDWIPDFKPKDLDAEFKCAMAYLSAKAKSDKLRQQKTI